MVTGRLEVGGAYEAVVTDRLEVGGASRAKEEVVKNTLREWKQRVRTLLRHESRGAFSL